MKIAELIEQIKTSLSTDTVLTAWCRKNFGKEQLIYVDIDKNNPPDPAKDYPVIAITGCRQLRSDSAREISFEFEIGFGIVNEEILVKDNTKTLTGFLQAEIFREMAENALYRSKIADVLSQSETNAVSSYPLFVSISTLSIKQLKTNRNAAKATILEVETSREASISFGLREMTNNNLKAVLLGENFKSLNQAAGNVYQASPVMPEDMYIELGHLDVFVTKLTGAITGSLGVGDTITGETSSATGKIAFAGAGFIELVNVSGSFKAGE